MSKKISSSECANNSNKPLKAASILGKGLDACLGLVSIAHSRSKFFFDITFSVISAIAMQQSRKKDIKRPMSALCVAVAYHAY